MECSQTIDRALAPEILGQLIPAAWQVAMGNRTLPHWRDLVAFIVAAHDVPGEVADAFGPIGRHNRFPAADIVAAGIEARCLRFSDVDALDLQSTMTFFDAVDRIDAISRVHGPAADWLKARIAAWPRMAVQPRAA